MKKFLIFILFPFYTYAQMPIEEVNLGSCWTQNLSNQVGYPYFKIASFGFYKPGAFQITNDGFKTIENILKKFLSVQLAITGNAQFGISINCSAASLIVMIPLEVSGARYCVKGNLESGDNNLKLNDIDPDPENNSFESCYGIVKGSILFGLKNKSDSHNAMTLIRQRFSEFLEDVEYDQGSSFIELKLKSTYYFRENEIKKKLEADPILNPYRLKVGFNNLNITVGELRPLWGDKITLP